MIRTGGVGRSKGESGELDMHGYNNRPEGRRDRRAQRDWRARRDRRASDRSWDDMDITVPPLLQLHLRRLRPSSPDPLVYEANDPSTGADDARELHVHRGGAERSSLMLAGISGGIREREGKAAAACCAQVDANGMRVVGVNGGGGQRVVTGQKRRVQRAGQRCKDVFNVGRERRHAIPNELRRGLGGGTASTLSGLDTVDST
ncbi:hypothetical protein FB45DRAFT_866808 [Roridomyces roridus]|uniref:Uncharacterized protein n=1 Tax=Roridomyces roridus TaxID=1738132 RepID=A0AAD7BT57_9AGAR|nr:hypothetical protein FB45DRAFT_866808 [Roridomyces roridus]